MSNLPQLTSQMKAFINNLIQERKENIDPKTIVNVVFTALKKSFEQPIPIDELIKYVELVMPLDKEAEGNVLAIKRAFSELPRLSHGEKQSISSKLEEIFKKILNEKLERQDLCGVMERYIAEGVKEVQLLQRPESCRIESLKVTPEQNKALFLEMLLRYVSETQFKPEDVRNIENTMKNLKYAGCKASAAHTAIWDSVIATRYYYL